MFRKLTQTYSFEQLYKKNYAPLYYYAFRFITDEEVCKDIVNDVFEKAWQNFGKMNSETASAYLYAQVRSRCIDHLRHQQVEEQYANFYRAITEKDVDTSPDEREERLQRIEAFIEQLKDPTKTILKECYYENKKYQEVAENFGISISGVKKHIMKALKMLREEFNIRKTVPENEP